MFYSDAQNNIFWIIFLPFHLSQSFFFARLTLLLLCWIMKEILFFSTNCSHFTVWQQVIFPELLFCSSLNYHSKIDSLIQSFNPLYQLVFSILDHLKLLKDGLEFWLFFLVWTYKVWMSHVFVAPGLWFCSSCNKFWAQVGKVDVWVAHQMQIY